MSGAGAASAVVVTRGDVDLRGILNRLKQANLYEAVVWDNCRGPMVFPVSPLNPVAPARDLAVYGRYAAVEHASQDVIFVQDDDCLLPVESIDAILAAQAANPAAVACNMPAAWRSQEFYRDHALVGFGAAFHRDLPARAFGRYRAGNRVDFDPERGPTSAAGAEFARCCDVVFTALTPRVLVDVPYENLPWAEADGRMYRRPEHVAERAAMLDLARKVSDATLREEQRA